MFANYRWAWNLRGVTAQERLVALMLADEADSAGRVAYLKHATIARRCGFNPTSRHSQKIIRALIDKQFLSRSAPRFGAYGQQVSNGYRLRLDRYHPPSVPGRMLWDRGLETLAGAAEGRQRTKVELHAEHSTAYYHEGGALLSIFLPSKYAVRFFATQSQELLDALQGDRWPVHRVELLSTDGGPGE